MVNCKFISLKMCNRNNNYNNKLIKTELKQLINKYIFNQSYIGYNVIRQKMSSGMYPFQKTNDRSDG